MRAKRLIASLKKVCEANDIHLEHLVGGKLSLKQRDAIHHAVGVFKIVDTITSSPSGFAGPGYIQIVFQLKSHDVYLSMTGVYDPLLGSTQDNHLFEVKPKKITIWEEVK